MRLRREAVAPLLARLPAAGALSGCAGEAQSVSAELADALWRGAGADDEIALAIELARGVQPSTFGLLTYLAAASDTVGHALRRLVAHYGWLSTAATYDVERAGDGGALTCRVHGRQAPSAGREVFGIAVAAAFVARQAIDLPAPREVSLRVEAGGETRRAAEAFFGAPVRFGAVENRVVLGRGAWTRPLRRAEPGLAVLLEAHARQQALPRASMTERARELLRVDARACEPDVARTLGVSARSLRRHLAAEGASWSGLRDEARQAQAEAWLGEGRPVAEIATGLGFSEPAAFRRAFRRWTGLSPGAYARGSVSPAPSR